MSIRLDQRIPLSKLQIIDQMPSPLRRKAKIFVKKLPDDFFSKKSVSLVDNHRQKDGRRSQIHTQGFSRRISNIQRISETRQLIIRPGNLSSRRRDEPQNAIQLFKDIIKTSRDMKKMIRKHSLELKKQNDDLRFQNARLQLPPLLLKKGVTSLL